MTELAKIYERLGGIEEGIRGTNTRLDTLNSKVAKHEQRFNDIAIADVEAKGVVVGLQTKHASSDAWREKLLTMGLHTIVTVISVLSVLVLIRTGILDLDKEPQSLTEVQQKAIELEAEIKTLQTQRDALLEEKENDS